jgi:hypothetical protein
MKRVQHKRRFRDDAARPRLRLVTTPPPAPRSAALHPEPETYELRLNFSELALIYKSLQAAKTLGALPPQDDLLTDTIQVVDQALNRAV